MLGSTILVNIRNWTIVVAMILPVILQVAIRRNLMIWVKTANKIREPHRQQLGSGPALVKLIKVPTTSMEIYFANMAMRESRKASMNWIYSMKLATMWAPGEWSLCLDSQLQLQAKAEKQGVYWPLLTSMQKHKMHPICWSQRQMASYGIACARGCILFSVMCRKYKTVVPLINIMNDVFECPSQ